MTVFHDANGRPWPIAIHVTAVTRCRDQADIDLYGLVKDGMSPLAELLADPVRLIQVLWVLCQAEAAKAGVSPEQFGEGFYGDAIDRAAAAFVEELAGFFPKAPVRDAIRKLIELNNRAMDQMLDKMAAELDQIDVDAAVAEITAPPEKG